MEGGREFLQAMGFTSVMLPVEGQGKPVPQWHTGYVDVNLADAYRDECVLLVEIRGGRGVPGVA